MRWKKKQFRNVPPYHNRVRCFELWAIKSSKHGVDGGAREAHHGEAINQHVPLVRAHGVELLDR
eukprot:9178145-Pyramimonas_sp.AAC.1